LGAQRKHQVNQPLRLSRGTRSNSWIPFAGNLAVVRMREEEMGKRDADGRLVLVRLALATLIVALYGLSIVLDVFHFRGMWAFNSGTAASGGEVLLYGCLGIVVGAIGWYANLLFLPGLILFSLGNLQPARWIAVAALLIALSSLLLRGLPNGSGLGGATPIASFGLGFYTWLSSLALLAAATFAPL
jgi:hypothetical protein